MNYITREPTKDGSNEYIMHLDDGVKRKATDEEQIEAFGTLPISITVERNNTSLYFYANQYSKTGIVYWAPLITKENLQSVLYFLGEEKLMSYLQMRLNQECRDMSIDQKVRSKDWMKVSVDELVSRFERMSTLDPERPLYLKRELVSLLEKLKVCSSDEERTKLNAAITENVSKQQSKKKH